MALFRYPKECIAARAALSSDDHALIARCRGTHNRLGFAYQMAFVRLMGRLPNQHPLEIHDDLLAFVADELHVDPEVIQTYARRQPTVSNHQEQIRGYIDLKPFSQATQVDLDAFLIEEAHRLEQHSALRSRAEEFLRERHVLLPADSTLKRIVSEQREKARQALFSRMMGTLSSEVRTRLDDLLVVGENRISPLQRLKESPGFPSPRALLRLCDKLDRITETGVHTLDLTWLNNNLQRSMARHVEHASVYRLRRLKAPRRYTAQVCFLHQTYYDTVDQIVEMHSRLITDTHRRAERELDEELKRKRGWLRAALMVLHQMSLTMLDDGLKDDAIRAAVFEFVSRERLEEHAQETEEWLKGTSSDAFPRVQKRFTYLRQFAPTLLEHLNLQVEPAGNTPLLGVFWRNGEYCTLSNVGQNRPSDPRTR